MKVEASKTNMTQSSLQRFLRLLTAASTLAACQSDDSPSQAADAAPPDATPVCEATYTIFLNRAGGDYSPGGNDPGKNLSFILTEPATLQPYGADDAIWNAAVACVKEDLAPFQINVTEIDPGDTGPGQPPNHMEVAVIQGGPDVIGLAEGTTSIAPFSCNPILGLAFVFGGAIAEDAPTLCKQMEFTIAKMFGIENHVECGDISSFEVMGSCDGIEATVVDAELQCGEFEPTLCQCGREGATTSNSYDALVEHAGLCPQ